MVTPLRRTATTTALSDGWPSHHVILHRQWLTEKCWNICVQCGICPPSGPGFLPRNFNLSMFFFCVFLKAFLKIRMQKKGVMKMIFLELRNRSAPLFLNPVENKMVSLFFPLPSSSFSFFFSPSYCYFSVLIWSPLPLFKILKSTRYQSMRFCLHPTAWLEQWNDNQDKKSCSSGHAGLA